MLTLEQGAKMLVVAWVKDWNMRTLMDILDEKTKHDVTDERLEELHKNFPFMPIHKYWYIANKGRGLNTMKFVADAYPKLSEKFFNANSNEVRLKNAPYIMKQNARDVLALTKYSKDEVKHRAENNRDYRSAIGSYRLSREAFKKAHRNAWEVVK